MIGRAALLAVAFAGCIDHRCPKGYDQKGDTCYRKRDAGPDGAVDGDAGTDAESDAEGPIGADDAGAMDAGDEGDAEPIPCGQECGEHEICERVDDAPACVCAGGYDACESGCADLDADPMNCGKCGYQCESGLACKQGECEQKIRELVLGGDRSCAVYDAPNGQYPVKCWGDTGSKFFRDAATEALRPRSIVGVRTARGIALAWTQDEPNWQCVMLPERDVVRCWGNCGAACGNSGTAALTDTFFDNDVLALARAHVNSFATCASTALGTTNCWGAASMIASDVDTSSPRLITVGGQSTFDDLSLGAQHGCGVTQDGGVVCWGANLFGQLGAPTDSNMLAQRGVFVTKESGGELSDVVDVEAGTVVSCAITAQRELWCWGANQLGGLGSGDSQSHVGAVHVELADVSHVAVGWWHTCAIVRDGQVYCWGSTPALGLGEAFQNQGDIQQGTAFSRPQKVLGLDDAVEIRAGKSHSCARRRSGHILCWGANEKGQLGDGTAVTRLAPTPVAGLD